MNTTSAASHHHIRTVLFATLLTLVFAVSAWAMVSVGHFSESVTVATLVVSAFCASWFVTGHRHADHGTALRPPVR